ncbi:MAG: protein kinase [Candidatus Aminicenantes bacterium]|nr:protein kinase [Candidatus Aminicenantes bacterium]
MTLVSDVSDTILPGGYIIQERFKVLKKLGKGGMGEVLLAEDVKLKRKVAIKSILLKDNIGLTDTTSKLRFLREAQTASQLDHPNICTIYEIYEEGDRDYIVMQYIDGVTLDQIIGMQKLSVDKILDICIQVCDGIIEAHSHDIIHRDIKPGNIMVDKKGIVRILDFGLAKFSDDSFVRDGDRVDSDLTEKGFVMGTVAYISPEQARGKLLDWQTDIFSFGVVLYEMIEGKNPFREDEQIETLYNVLNKDIEFTRDIPEELKQIAGKALERDKAKRYPDFFHLKQDLEAFRTLYQQTKEEKPQPVGAETEIIQYDEQAKLLEEVQKTSDKEDLGDLVYRIKQFKASTERVPHTTGKRKLNFKWILLALAAAVVVVAGVYLLLKPSPPPPPVPTEKFYIYLHPFEFKGGDKFLPDMLDYLLMESLNQFEEFKTINKDFVVSFAEGKNEAENLKRLKSKFDIKYELMGKIVKNKNFYNIDAELSPIKEEKGEAQEGYRLTSAGELRDSFLGNQVDLLTRLVYQNLFPRKAKKQKKYKRVKEIFGTQWKLFSEFYRGLRHYNRLDLKKAEPNFLDTTDLLISKYYLADLYDFDGSRTKALEIIDEIIPQIDSLTLSLQLKVRTIEAKLKFRFIDEISNLEKLKEEFPYSKEVLYKLGEAYFHIANPEKAMKHYKEALKLDQRYSLALNHLGYCHSYLGEHIQALKVFQQYRDIDESYNSFDSLGDGYYYSGDLVNAEAMKKRAVLEDDPKERLPWPYQTLADIYILKAQYKKADESLTEYKELQRITKSNLPKAEAYAQAKRAFIAYKDRRYDDALRAINLSLQTYNSDDIKEDSSEAIWLKGLILLALDNLEESKKQLKWLEQFKNKYNLDWNNFKAAYKYFIHLEASILEKENRRQEAEERFKQLLDMKTKLSYWITYYHYQFFHTEYAKFLTRNQRYEEALSELEKCFEFNGNYIPALWLKAKILKEQNKPEEERAIYEKIAELYGESLENNYHRDLLKTKLNPT